MSAFPHDGQFVDPACPLDWSHPLNRGLAADLSVVPNSGWSGGATVRDLVRGGRKPNDGAITNATWVGGGSRGRALRFDGTGDYVTVPHSAAIAIGGAGASHSIAIDFKATGSAPDGVLSRKGGSSDRAFVVLWESSASSIRAQLYNGSNFSSMTASTSYRDGLWHQLLVVRDSAALVYSMYVDGVLAASDATADVAADYTTTSDWTVGQQGAGTSSDYAGDAVNFRLWTRALSAGQVRAFYDETRRGNPTRFRWVSTRSYWSTQAAGGTPFTGSYAGSVTASGALAKAVSKAFAGSSTAAGALAKAASKPLAGNVTGAGALAKATAKPLAGSASPTGTLAKAAAKVLGGSLTAAGVLTKAVAKAMTGSSTASGALTVLGVKLVSLGGSVTGVGGLVRAVAKALAGLVTPAGDLSTSGGTVTVQAAWKTQAAAGRPAGTQGVTGRPPNP